MLFFLNILIIILFLDLVKKENKIIRLEKLLKDQSELKKDLKIIVENIDFLKEEKKTLKDVFFFK
jgi:cell division protein FtsB